MTQPQRILVVDALRGFAIISIMLLHNIEHFDFYFFPEALPEIIKKIDGVIWASLFFLFGGKSYAIFALLFGFTYHIQSTNQHKKGNRFDRRFAWRMLLLFGFGMINSAFFQGDILSLYAAVGILMIPLSRLNQKSIIAVIVILFLMPAEWYHLWMAIQSPLKEIPNPESWSYFGKAMAYMKEGAFWEVIIGNLTNGKKGVVLWNWENGRFFHMLALFLTGMLIGRKELFVWTDTNKQFWKKTLLFSFMIFVVLFVINLKLESWIEYQNVYRAVNTMESAWMNISFMVVLVSGFVLIFYSGAIQKVFDWFTPIGKMSLSNYVMQSILGSTIYYGFGLGLYQYTGATYGLIIGLLLAGLTGWFCQYWMKRHRHGPLEGVWHQLTWL
jgi:uncharacterized protein